MATILKSILVLICFVSILGFGSTNISEVKAATTNSISDELFFNVTTVVENGTVYLCVYVGDVLVMKVEDL